MCCAAATLAVLAATITQSGPTIRLSASALIMGATNQTLSVPPATPEYIRDYLVNRDRDYIAPTGLCSGGEAGCALVAVYGPNQLGPFTGLLDMSFDESVAAGMANLNTCVRGALCMLTAAPYTDTDHTRLRDTSFVVSGGSQSAIIAGYEKADLIAAPVDDRTVSFVVTSNPSRPNGGVFARFPGGSIPFIGITFAPATPTNSSRDAPLFTVDIARQYDGWDDFPTNPLNLLATTNAVLGTIFLHAEHLYQDGPAELQGYFQDTTYYLTPTVVMPILRPLAAVPVIGMPMAKLLDAPLRVLVEAGYDRTVNPGQPEPARFLYFPNPVRTLVDLAVAVPTGWDDAISYVTGDPANRPFHTAVPGPYGVGGPPVYAGAVDPYQDGVTTTAAPAKTVRASRSANPPGRAASDVAAVRKGPVKAVRAANKAPRTLRSGV